MQMYDGLPIITNKITVEEQQGIPHHLLGFIALDEEPWRVGMFKRKASQIIKEIRSRGRLPIVVGGTHYYTQSLLFGDSLVSDNIDGDEGMQTELSNQEISEKFPILDSPTEAILERLREVDPKMADRWHPNDRRKIRRSLEIFLLSGKKASDIYAEQKEGKYSNITADPVEVEESGQLISDHLLFWVHSDSEILKKRLDGRVDKMLEAGLLQEVKSMNEFLHKQAACGITVDRSRGIWVSIGWKEFEPYLCALETGSESTKRLGELYELSIEQTKSATRQYARRQTRWIRLKLMPALSDQNALDKLYLLDGSDIKSWAINVSKPAIEIADSFLAGHELHAPSELSEAAKHLLIPENTLDDRGISIRQECDICNVVCVQEGQWQTHLKSRRHRQLLKKRQRNPNGMSSLPRNDNKSDSSETS
jgi:tRNA dimethylallyltransferase